MLYKESFIPRICDFDRNGAFTYEAILQMLETAGSHHSNQANDNVIAGSQSGIAWILVEWRVNIHRMPGNSDTLHLTTWVRGKAPAAMVYRNFIVTDDQDQTLLEAEATFVLLDTAKGRLTRISEELFAAYGPEDTLVFPDTLPRLQPAETVLFSHPIPLRRSDIDFNGHVHNTKYIDFALEGLPSHVFSSHHFSSLRIVYSKAVKEMDEVVMNYALVDGAHRIALTVNQTVCAMIEMK